MPIIPAEDARGIFTKTLVDVFRERPQTTSFCRSFFPSRVSNSRELSIEVQRGTEKVAVDVTRGTEGNRNSVSRSTEKIFLPPYYREYFDLTELDLYDRLFGSTSIDEGVFADFINETVDKTMLIRDKIERALEKQCAEVLLTGIVSLKAGTNIDFKRKAASLVDGGSGSYWTVGSVDPYVTLENGGNFLRQVGKVQGGILNVIMGSKAFNAFMNNPQVKTRADIRNFHLDNLRMPQRDAVGGVLHGVVSAGPYEVRLWSYPEYYDTENGTSTPYITPEKVIMLPEVPKFRMGFAAVPRLLTEGGIGAATGEFVVGEYLDHRRTSHIIDVKSAGVAIPVGVDQVYTVKVVA